VTYLSFLEVLYDYKVFSVRDVTKLFPDFDTRRLVEWQRKGYIKKLINKWYLFSDVPIDDWLRYRISNCLHRPSYISMESALSYYNLIPEGVFSPQNVTTRKTITYETTAGSFHYRSLKPHLFFGYRADRNGGPPLLMADPEKAILDYLYLNTHINTVEDLESLRLNMAVMNDLMQWNKFDHYAACFESATLNKRVRILQNLREHANIS
jgi:predicted transcriptional regulator of viral defense system